MSSSRICTLKRCQGKRGCICPSGSFPVGSYAGRKLEPITVSPEKGPHPNPSVEIAKKLPKVTPKKLEPLKFPSNIKESVVVDIPAKQDTTIENKISVEDEGEGVDGMVMIRYNHYKKKFIVAKGSTTTAAIDSEYFLSFAFPNSKIHVTLFGPSDFSFEEKGLTRRPLVRENPPGTYHNLDPNKEYWVEIEEDENEKRAYEERQDLLAKESAVKRAEEELLGVDANAIIKSKTESCSCIEGNPCLDRYACKNWEDRYEVAKKNGWKGFQ